MKQKSKKNSGGKVEKRDKGLFFILMRYLFTTTMLLTLVIIFPLSLVWKQWKNPRTRVRNLEKF